MTGHTRTFGRSWPRALGNETAQAGAAQDAGPAAAGLLALFILGGALALPDRLEMSAAPAPDKAASAVDGAAPSTASQPEWTFGGYGGIAHTLPTIVEIKDGKGTDLKVQDFGWIGMPFKAPIYYGLRSQRWAGASPFGAMLDFTHAKAIAKREDVASFSGTLDGKPVPPKAKIRDFFSKLEFSHGHNMLTMNGLLRLAPWWVRLRPYIGAGGGISLPHSEVGIRTKKTRTYEYHYAGVVGQALAGVELQLGRASVFIEYKFTYAPYDIPLSHEPYGWLLVTDLWRQFKDWWDGKAPPGGRLTTTLISHHGIAGVLVKNRTYMDRITN